MIKKVVIYKNENYYVKCSIDKDLNGKVEVYDNPDFLRDHDTFIFTHNLDRFGDNHIDIISNIIKHVYKEDNFYDYEEINKFKAWDGNIN